MTLILVLVGITQQGFALWNFNTVKATFMQTELNTWLCTSCHNVMGNPPASDRMGYGYMYRQMFRPGLMSPIGELLIGL